MKKVICIEKDLLRSEAFRSLDRWSMLVCMDFLRKRKMKEVKTPKKSSAWIIENNGQIVYPYAEAERKGISRRNFCSSIDKIADRGFLDINHHGSGGRKGDMTTYFISERWKNYGAPSFQPARNPRPKDTRQGRGWAVLMADLERKKSIMEKRSSVSFLTPENTVSNVQNDTPKAKKCK